MKRFFERRHNADLEQRLRSERPAPRDEFVSMLAERLDDRPRRRSARRSILVLAVATAALAAALAGTGGFAYAASAVKTVATTAKIVIAAPVSVVKTDSKPSTPSAQPSSSSKDDGGQPDEKQYGHTTQVCHHPGPHQRTLTISNNAVPAHLAHGDYTGACH